MVALFYNGYRNPNGTITITEHLVKMFEFFDEEVSVYRLRNKPGKPKTISTAGGTIVEEVTLEQAKKIVDNNAALMIHFMHDKSSEQELAVKLIYDTGIPFILHDYRGLVQDIIDAAIFSDARIVFIREPFRQTFVKDHKHIDTIHIKHPYIRHEVIDGLDIVYNAVSIPRIGREKKIELVCEANNMLHDKKKIMIAGADSDRLYAHFTLDKKFPEWRDYHIKAPGIDSYALSCMSRYVIDLSELKGDGGGTQYTFLEAMDAGALLVINRNWIGFPNSEMIHGYNCIAIGTPAELANVVSNSLYMQLDGYVKTLKNHSPEAIGEDWLRVCYER